MNTDVIERLPSREEIGREIVQTSQKARRLRSLYRLVSRIEREKEIKYQQTSDSSESANA